MAYAVSNGRHVTDDRWRHVTLKGAVRSAILATVWLLAYILRVIDAFALSVAGAALLGDRSCAPPNNTNLQGSAVCRTRLISHRNVSFSETFYT